MRKDVALYPYTRQDLEVDFFVCIENGVHVWEMHRRDMFNLDGGRTPISCQVVRSLRIFFDVHECCSVNACFSKVFSTL